MKLTKFQKKAVVKACGLIDNAISDEYAKVDKGKEIDPHVEQILLEAYETLMALYFGLTANEWRFKKENKEEFTDTEE